MVFCTGCGSPLNVRHGFCSECGTAAERGGQGPPDAGPPAHEAPDPAAGPKPAGVDSAKLPDVRAAIDRKTLFADGMLVLTHENVVLYSPDELDEIKRIPLETIASCSRGMTKRSLVLKLMVNIGANFAKYVDGRQGVLDEAAAEIQRQKELLRRARSPDKKRSLNSKISDLEAESRALSKELDDLQADPAEIRRVKRERADIVKEVFRLPKDYSARAVSEEYKIWEYAIRRRMAGLSSMRVYTSPPDAVVLVDGAVSGSTPVTLEKPLTDAAALTGRHEVQVLLEGHKPKTFSMSAAPDRGPENRNMRLSTRDAPDRAFDSTVSGYREVLPDRTINLEQYDLELETVGTEGILALARDQVLVLSADRERWLLEIPYADMTEVKLEKRLARGIRGIVISYREGGLSGLKYAFEMDADSGYGDNSAVRRRYEAIVERLRRNMRESRTHALQPRPHLPQYYEITEQDIANGFDRFDPYSFERLVARLFTSKGYRTEVTQGSGDMGVDVVASNSSETIAIQVKKWRGNVGGPDVHKTLGSMVSHRATRALVVTTSDFTNQAYDILRGGSPVDLWNGQRLANEFREHLIQKG
ncbi:MAG: restriction endonuclease [Nitrosopumilaceae archaeon]|nr:restriction endonuclease [Nitrosopumilaceae archaeon]